MISLVSKIRCLTAGRMKWPFTGLGKILGGRGENQVFVSGHVKCEMPITQPSKGGKWIHESGVWGKGIQIWESSAHR